MDYRNRNQGRTLITITLFANYFTVTTNVKSPRIQELLGDVCKHLTMYTTMFDRRSKRTIKQKDKSYYTYIKYKREYRFPSTIFRDFISELGTIGITRDRLKFRRQMNYRLEQETNLKFNTKYILRDYQKKYTELLTDDDQPSTQLVDLQTGYGKASCMDSLLLTPNGWIEMRDVQVGTILYTPDGDTTEVIEVFPQGVLELYRLTFADGRTHDCCSEHLWSISTEEHGMSVRSTHDIGIMLQCGIVPYIDLPNPPKTDFVKLEMDPYLLGYLMGSVQDVKTKNLHDIIHLDKIMKISKWLYKSILLIDGNNQFKTYYNKLDVSYDNVFSELNNPVSEDDRSEHIPISYMRSSKEQKYQLLSGLFISGGRIDKDGIITYGTQSMTLCDDVVELVRSLGGMAMVKQPMYKRRLKHKPEYDYLLIVYLPEPLSCRDSLSKQKLMQTEETIESTKLKLCIKKIEPIGLKPAQCISIDSPNKLYVTGDYVVTHNTVIAMNAVVKLQYKLAIIVLPKYIDKWVSDVKDTTNIVDEEICVIRGSASLIDLMVNGSSNYKIIIFSLRTITNYIKEYETGRIEEFKYPIQPEELMSKLHIGIILNDESHQEYHALYKASLYFDVKKFIGLSATLISDQEDITRMHNLLFPTSCRISGLAKYNRYIYVHAVEYTMTDVDTIKHARARGYSHTLFEQSIMSNPLLCSDYVDMIMWYVKKAYISQRMKGDRLLIFAATVDMCTLLQQTIKKLYLDLDVRRYVEDDDYVNLKADICVTTVLSAGTAVDIPNLIACIQTISIGSVQANLQAVGRLRNIPNRKVRYYYVYCNGLEKQYKLHRQRVAAIAKVIKQYTKEEYHKVLNN